MSHWTVPEERARRERAHRTSVRRRFELKSISRTTTSAGWSSSRFRLPVLHLNRWSEVWGPLHRSDVSPKAHFPLECKDMAEADASTFARIQSVLTEAAVDTWGLPDAAVVARIETLDAAESPYLEDVVLAFACAEQCPRALQHFERRYGDEFAGALSRLALDRFEIDEVAQIVREKLFVHHPEVPPKILDYAGRGSFAGWLRAVILRVGIDRKRSQIKQREQPEDVEPLVDLAVATEDLELESLRAKYNDSFRDAVRDALRALSVDERNTLRLNVVEGLNIEQIGTLYGVHRATVARWIARAKEAIATNTRRLLSERLDLPGSDVDSLVRLFQSHLDVGSSVFDSAGKPSARR